MSKLIIQLELGGVTEIADTEANDYAWTSAHLYFEFGIPADDSYIIGSDRYTLDHKHALKQGDIKHG